MKRARMKESMQNDSRIIRSSERVAESGFTLLETAIAFTIMLIIGLASTALFLYANSYNSGAAERALAVAVAKQRMELLRNVAYDDALLTVPTGQTTATSTITVSNGGKNYTVTKTVDIVNNNCTAGLPCDSSKRITLTVTPQDSNPLWGATPVTLVTFRSSLGAGPYIK